MTGSTLTGGTRSAPRLSPRAERDWTQKLSASLTDRDQEICLAIYEHGVLTTEQIFELFFSSPSRARRRLHELWLLHVVRRLRPQHRPGSLPWHYLLDRFGVLVVAECKGLDPKELGYRIDRGLGLVNSQRLRHTREMNSFFTRLAHACRLSGDYALSLWLSEERCRGTWGEWLTPDGLGRIEGPHGKLTLALEMDLGTEKLSALENKMERYRMIVGAGEDVDVVLIVFHSDKRELSARRVLSGYGFTVATSTIERHKTDPLGATWWPPGSDHRIPLTQLRPFADRGSST